MKIHRLCVAIAAQIKMNGHALSDLFAPSHGVGVSFLFADGLALKLPVTGWFAVGHELVTVA